MTESKLTLETFPWDLGGQGKTHDDLTVLQDAGRSGDMVFLTVMAQRASDQKLIPLSSVDQAMTPASLACSGIGGTAPEFAALSDAEFGITVDGVAIELADMDFTGLDAEDDVPGFLTCGANGANIGAWNAITDGAFKIPVNGVTIELTGLDFSTGITLNDIADTVNAQAMGRFTCVYNGKLDIYLFHSNTTGETSIVAELEAPAAGTDIAASGFFDGKTGGGGGVPTAGTGGEATFQSLVDIINAHALGRFTVEYNGDNFVFFSPTLGPLQSQITVLSDPSAGGTDISGPGFLNGLTGGAGTVTAGTGANGTDKPAGVLMGRDITEAAIVAGDVDDQVLLIGSDKMIDEDMLVLENSLALSDVVVSTGLTIRASLELLGIYPRKSINDQQIQPI